MTVAITSTHTRLEQFELNKHLDWIRLADDFVHSGRIHVYDFLTPEGAEILYRHLLSEAAWTTFFVSKGKLYSHSLPAAEQANGDHEQSVLKLAHESEQHGFACLYDADRPLQDDLIKSTGKVCESNSVVMKNLLRFLNSRFFLEFLRTVCGNTAISRVDAQAVRLRVGHFETFHNATLSADPTRKRVGGFTLSVTPEWKPEWGGLLEFRTDDGGTIEGFVPCFNGLVLFSFPNGHWISAVAPFAGGPRLAISGRFYT
jgi:SM-20-related protein